MVPYVLTTEDKSASVLQNMGKKFEHIVITCMI